MAEFEEVHPILKEDLYSEYSSKSKPPMPFIAIDKPLVDKLYEEAKYWMDSSKYWKEKYFECKRQLRNTNKEHNNG